jgi:hypothetical protein
MSKKKSGELKLKLEDTRLRKIATFADFQFSILYLPSSIRRLVRSHPRSFVQLSVPPCLCGFKFFGMRSSAAND